jgi:CTP synthase
MNEGLDVLLLKRLNLPVTTAHLEQWTALVERIRNPKDTVTIHFVGKYVEHKDAYKSIIESLHHGGFQHQLKVDLRFVEAEALEERGGEKLLQGSMGIVVGPGFGNRGSRGMMKAAEFARTTGTPYFGICYGFQWAVVEFARGVAGLTSADSTEVTEDAEHKVIYKLRDLLGVDDLGGTMRLGSYDCKLTPGSLAARLYGKEVITERHRHRYEFNCLYEKTLTDNGLKVVGRSIDGKFVEIVEIPDHPCFIAVQFHPEFHSKPLAPHPLFAGFIAAAHAVKSKRNPAGLREVAG